MKTRPICALPLRAGRKFGFKFEARKRRLKFNDSKFKNVAELETGTNLSRFVKFEFAVFALNLSPFGRVLRDCR